MKADELMVGDWVYGCTDPYDQDEEQKKYPVKVIRIDAYGDIMTEGENPFTEPYEDEWWNLEPIPLTPEILEKNFGVVERSSDGYSCVINRELLLAFHLEATLDIWIAQPSDWPHLTYSLPLPRYVHELQHALRICGIEKEIVL